MTRLNNIIYGTELNVWPECVFTINQSIMLVSDSDASNIINNINKNILVTPRMFNDNHIPNNNNNNNINNSIIKDENSYYRCYFWPCKLACCSIVWPLDVAGHHYIAKH